LLNGVDAQQHPHGDLQIVRPVPACAGRDFGSDQRARGKLVYTNKLRFGAFRGFGNPQVSFAGEQQIDVATLDAMGEALRGQAEMAKAGGQWVSAISALVRPLVTYWFVVLYSAHKIAMMVLAHETQGLGWAQVFATTWGEQDWAIFSMIVVFWFVGRVHERAAPRG
jgi:hypothetical protein